jgi:hypothetical protein
MEPRVRENRPELADQCIHTASATAQADLTRAKTACLQAAHAVHGQPWQEVSAQFQPPSQLCASSLSFVLAIAELITVISRDTLSSLWRFDKSQVTGKVPEPGERRAYRRDLRQAICGLYVKSHNR